MTNINKLKKKRNDFGRATRTRNNIKNTTRNK